MTSTLTTDHARAAHLVQPFWRWDEVPVATFVVTAAETAPFKDTTVMGAALPIGMTRDGNLTVLFDVAALRLFPRTLATPHFSAPAIGLGGVFVAEAYRGQGIAGRMLADCCARLAADGHLFAVLWARSHRDLYGRAGFVEVDPQLWVKSLRSDVQVFRGRHHWTVTPKEKF